MATEEPEKPLAVLKGTIKIYKWHAEVEESDGKRYVIAPNSNGWVHWIVFYRDDQPSDSNSRT